MPSWMCGVTGLYRVRDACITENLGEIKSKTRENRSIELRHMGRRNKSRERVNRR